MSRGVVFLLFYPLMIYETRPLRASLDGEGHLPESFAG